MNSHLKKIIKSTSPAYGQADGEYLIPVETWKISQKKLINLY